MHYISYVPDMTKSLQKSWRLAVNRFQQLDTQGLLRFLCRKSVSNRGFRRIRCDSYFEGFVCLPARFVSTAMCSVHRHLENASNL